MKLQITTKDVSIKDLVHGYKDSGEEGVVAYDGNLDIRPPYQRELVYSMEQMQNVIRSVIKGFPISVMYWSDNGDGTYELLDGQQRTLSICKFVAGDYSIDNRYWFNLTQSEKDAVLDYKLQVYTCTGSDTDKLDWFGIINIAGEKLTTQELRNAVYRGPWLTDAKKKFRVGGPAVDISDKYLKKNALRQELLETALSWKADAEKTTIEDYMAKNQNEESAAELWQYFQEVISWAKRIFPMKRRELTNINWGFLYEAYVAQGRPTLKADALETEIKRLLLDDDVTNKRGIYAYLIFRDLKYLNIRQFSSSMRSAVYTKQEGLCAKCKAKTDISGMEADHITPWSKGGKTVIDNCQMLCLKCNRTKSDK